jgi:hypothetical protein
LGVIDLSALPPIDPYVETYFWLSEAWKSDVPGEWVRRDTIERWLTVQMMEALDAFGSDIARPYPALASNIFDRLLEKGLIRTEKNPVAGSYYNITLELLKQFGKNYLLSSEIARQSEIIGHSLFSDVFEAYIHNEVPEDQIQAIDGVPVPASDRIVSLNHNQIDDVTEPLSDLIQQVEQTNGDPDHPGFRERVLGQLRAGRELLRAGSFRVYFLYTLLLTALAELIARHKGTAIAATAETLLQLLIQNVINS